MEAQVVLNGVGGVEDGPAGRDDQDEAVEGLRVEQTQIPVRSSAKPSHLKNVGRIKVALYNGTLTILFSITMLSQYYIL